MIARVLTVLGIALLAADMYFLFSMPVAAIDVTTSAVITICGDGIVGDGEVCDLGAGNNIGTYGSSTSQRICAADCVSFGPYCGDGTLQVRFVEQCDDGNNTSGDLCSSTCITEAPAPPSNPGSPTLGSIPALPGGQPGTIPSVNQTKVVLRGKAFPNSDVKILLDGKEFGTTRADANADFMYTSTQITPGISTFGFLGTDSQGIDSITTSVVFEVVQSAVTTVANVLLPPTITASAVQVNAGDPITLQGQSVPSVKVKADIFAKNKTSLSADTDTTGLWALQIDTRSLQEGPHTAKSLFELTADISSGYGRAVSFYVGSGSPTGVPSADINGDGKINLVDFSIFLLSWGKSDARSDFNTDGNVNLADFSIMLFNWTG